MISVIDDGKTSLYHLTPQAGQLLSFPPNIDTTKLYRLITSANNSDFMAMVRFNLKAPVDLGLLANFRTGKIEMLTGQVATTRTEAAPVLSKDGQYLRYVSSKDQNSLPSAILQRTLSTGKEKPLFTFDSTVQGVKHDEYGENWWITLVDPATKYITNILVDSTGATRVLAEETHLEGIQHDLFSSGFLTYPGVCDKDCTLSYQPLDGSPQKEFALPPMQNTYIKPLMLYENGDLLINVVGDDTYWLLRSDGSNRQLGLRPSAMSSWFPQEPLSPDGRFLLTVSKSPDAYAIWDFQRDDYLLHSEPKEIFAQPGILYGDGGFVFTNGFNMWLYRYTNNSKVKLPIEFGLCFDVFPDATILCYKSDTFVYDSKTDKTRPVIADVVPLFFS